jgi:hypothetical protein
MNIASGHEFVVAWDEKFLKVMATLDTSPSALVADKWINLSAAEAKELGKYLQFLADTLEARVQLTT